MISDMLKVNPSFIIVLSFFIIILTGAFLLTLPISSSIGSSTKFIDALFTANSATCVTGLVVLDTGVHFSLFGLVVIISLIQIGGLSYMTFSTFIFLLFRRKMFISEKLMMQEALNIYSTREVVSVVKKIFAIVFLVEGIGALILFLRWWPSLGLKKGLLYAVFHSVSAFCNAGFALPAGNVNLAPYCTDVVVNLVITSLIIIGGIGFIVISDILKNRRFSLHSKTVVFTTIFLIAVGTLLFYFFEQNNSSTLGSLTFSQKIMASYFHSVTPRTAGFNTLSIDKFYVQSLLLTILLMFIGASPGGTGGGIKTTTFSIILSTIWATLKGLKDTVIFERRIPFQTVRRSFVIAVLALLLVCSAVFALTFFEKDKTVLSLLFEVVSAFGTVGLSMGITPYLTTVGKIVIMLCMFIGRVGPLTLLLAFLTGQKEHKLEYPKEGISIG
ncbi:hypothetical protein A2230_06020 [candidate division WOR-1 bacterium RIFOXYA2_FULL_36_21]|uniref:Trk family potassium uptake protein n=1 Tax=candidate division WOR-1 bacterium RIFOXYB2_FULL_36_35 TaxID=1802578 RepID=A0A1F4S0U2_UNCSA|nr:MAG: hypothetical protein A2230_06020 [candidate division WOR-1 bacterium RIFOXYA2_FULL_36_21]OGC14052.1 MAG: hypothetical protein A2290_02940 [candidate division WOR-1 bacterium RIFOXYB2_FULL_36_35]OGC16149.1 MAG: hypothetical protein A2282_04590 [candidate division WOR-1 bacterium RIFOXYA12_FULL_36_13]